MKKIHIINEVRKKGYKDIVKMLIKNLKII